MVRRVRGRSAIAVVLTLLLLPSVAPAQEATPAGAPAEPIVVASGLTNPRGIAWDAAGVLYVAEAGDGGDSAGIVRIEDGCPVPVVEGLRSMGVYARGAHTGVADVAILDGQLYALVSALGSPAGIYRVETDGGTTLLADLEAWHTANPTAHRPPDYAPGGIWQGLAASGGTLWAVDANSGQIVTVAPTGEIARAADLSAADPIPTGAAPAPAGGVYVALLTRAPYPDGTAKIVRVAPDGTVSDAWTGLTAATDVAVAPDGTLYATELATGNTPDAFAHPGTGRIVRQTGPNTLEVIAAGLDYPVAGAFGPDGMLYVAGPALGGEAGAGFLLRLDVAGTGLPPAGATPATQVCDG